ncbi:hypothetical protein LQV63_30105 [Paenibacillus profundus]|uniref:Uncharacterized protein n=1 Tax=Paenibacillus profundus TaxID=1173085 RepID=A0ABS8YNV3_9BACL|nr:hypothetical protein [Paenibacillus profundus]MCE5173493.1 hypothetical protein [Paenibacillus profundus]
MKSPILQQLSNLPEGYEFSKGEIKHPQDEKFYAALKAEAKTKGNGKGIYTKKMEWKEVGRIHLEYTNGKDTLILSQYTVGPDEAKLKDFVYEHPYDKKEPDPNVPRLRVLVR